MTQITKQHLAAIIPAAATDETHYNINGVRLTPEGLEALDGHRIHRLRFNAPAQGIEPATLELKGIQDAAKRMRAKDVGEIDIEATQANGALHLRVDGAELAAPKLRDAGDWPQTDHVMPKREDAASVVALNPHYLKAACEAAIKASKGCRTPIIALSIPNPFGDPKTAEGVPMVMSAVRFDVPSAEQSDVPAELSGCIMPMRI